MVAGGVCLTLVGAAAGCATGGQSGPWERRAQLDCPNGTVAVTDTVIVTGVDGNRALLERRQFECARPARP
jgi:hypothetical protein